MAAVAGWLGVLLLVVLSASCGHQYFLTGSEVTPTPGPSSSSTASAGPTATATQGLVFATNNGDGQLSEFSRNLTSGALTLIGTTAVGAASGPTGLALSPSNGFLYVANSADHLIREFSVDSSSGALAAIGSVSDGAGSSPQRLATDSSGSFLYVTNGTGASISQYSIASDGTLVALGTFTAAGIVVQPTGIAAAPDGSAMYVADFGSGLGDLAEHPGRRDAGGGQQRGEPGDETVPDSRWESWSIPRAILSTSLTARAAWCRRSRWARVTC